MHMFINTYELHNKLIHIQYFVEAKNIVHLLEYYCHNALPTRASKVEMQKKKMKAATKLYTLGLNYASLAH